MGINTRFWKGKRVFITGHTGFKGSWLCLWMHHMGAYVTGYALSPPTVPSLFEMARISELVRHIEGDIRNYDNLTATIKKADPDVIFHMAAQPLVRESYDKPLDTFETNVMGTANVLQAARNCNSLRSIVIVTSDKCYENRDYGRPFVEGDPLGGYDPYSASKACAEIVSASYASSFFNEEGKVSIATVRAGNVIGGGDFAKDRIVPDIIKAWRAEKPVVLRNPRAIRPWQDVLEPLGGYIILAERLYAEGKPYAGAYNFGPPPEHCMEVGHIANELCRMLGGRWEHDESTQPHEAKLLTLSSEKAHDKLGWRSVFTLEETLEAIAAFVSNAATTSETRRVCIKRMDHYLRLTLYD